ncbi:MAG TPA: DUF374 domain-containing protein [Polyangiaceae bacterium]|nr:DUF374 domain-containing protein [Polyangiaceae bacterium]
MTGEGARPSRLRRLSGAALGALVWAWTRTLRLVQDGEVPASGRAVLAFLHGQQMALLAAKPERPIALLVSHSRDGELQTGALGLLGFSVVRGSSSRGGAAGLRGLARKIGAGMDVALAVDGPRGPLGRVKRGAQALAKAAGAVVVPVATAARHKLVLRSAWDQFEIPLPFTRVAVVLGAPVTAEDPAALERALAEARALAESRVARSRSALHPVAEGRS